LAGFGEFDAAIRAAGSALVTDMLDEDHEAVRRNLSALLREEEPAPGPKLRRLTKSEEVTQKLLFGFSEIQESIDNLHNIAIYVRRFPYANAGVEKGAYLRYHVENYLQELYILKERLKSYVTIVSRAYRLDPRGERLTAVAKAIEKHFREVFAGSLQARGRHVHERRHSDPELERLRALEMVHHGDPSLDRWYDQVYRETRRRKLAWIGHTNELVGRFLDVYFGLLYDLLFTSDGSVRQPSTAAQPARPTDAAR
jgi:predicted transcriptional regulator with HTH domain